MELEKRHLCFYFVLRTRPSTRRDAKTQSHEFIRSNTCFAKELQSIIKEFSELKESEIYRKASKLTVPWWIFCFVLLATLQEGAKAHYRVKHAKFEFANGRSHINEIVNFWGYAKLTLAKFHG